MLQAELCDHAMLDRAQNHSTPSSRQFSISCSVSLNRHSAPPWLASIAPGFTSSENKQDTRLVHVGSMRA